MNGEIILGVVTAYDEQTKLSEVSDIYGGNIYHNVGFMLQSMDVANNVFNGTPPTLGSTCLLALVNTEPIIVGYYSPPNVSDENTTFTNGYLNRSHQEVSKDTIKPGDTVVRTATGGEFGVRDGVANIKVSDLLYLTMNLFNNVLQGRADRVEFSTPAGDILVDLKQDKTTDVVYKFRKNANQIKDEKQPLEIDIGNLADLVKLKINGEEVIHIDSDKNITITANTVDISGSKEVLLPLGSSSDPGGGSDPGTGGGGDVTSEQLNAVKDELNSAIGAIGGELLKDMFGDSPSASPALASLKDHIQAAETTNAQTASELAKDPFSDTPPSIPALASLKEHTDAIIAELNKDPFNAEDHPNYNSITLLKQYAEALNEDIADIKQLLSTDISNIGADGLPLIFSLKTYVAGVDSKLDEAMSELEKNPFGDDPPIFTAFNDLVSRLNQANTDITGIITDLNKNPYGDDPPGFGAIAGLQENIESTNTTIAGIVNELNKDPFSDDPIAFNALHQNSQRIVSVVGELNKDPFGIDPPSYEAFSRIVQTTDGIASTVVANKEVVDGQITSLQTQITEIVQTPDSVTSVVAELNKDPYSEDPPVYSAFSEIKQTTDAISTTVSDIQTEQSTQSSNITQTASQIETVVANLNKTPDATGYTAISTLQQTATSISTALADAQQGLQSQITETAGEIDAVVANLNKDPTETGYAAISQIKQESDNVSITVAAKADKDYLVSQINACPESITFRSNLVDLSALVIHINGETIFDNGVLPYRALDASTQTTISTASTNASNAVTTANTASTTASNAQTTANTAKTTAETALASVNDMASDSKLTPVEKSVTAQQWAIIAGEKATIDAQATVFSITTEKTNYDNAYTALNTYLNDATSGIVKDLATTSDIDGATYRTNFQNYYSTKAILEKAISDAAKAAADSAASAASSASTAAANAQTTANSATTAAATAQTTANNAMNAINDMAADNKLTPVEKSVAAQQWAIIVGEKNTIDAQATAFGITTEKTSYDDAYNVLNTYLNDASTGLLHDLTTTSNITGATYRTNFQNYYSTKAVLQKAISDGAKSLADAAQSTANSVQASVNDMSADSKLTPVEKSSTAQQWMIISGEKATVDAQATVYGIVTEKTNYDSAYSTLDTYLNDVSTGLLHDLTTTSTIDGTVFRANFQNYYSKKALLEKAVSDAAKTAADNAAAAAAAAQTTANSAMSAINDMAADNKLTAVEKSATAQQWSIISAEKSTIDAQATAYGVTTEKTNYDNAYNTLNTYLNDASTGLLKDLATTSAIDGPTYRTNFQTYYSTRALLEKAVSDAAKVLADAAQTTANSAQTAATNAGNAISDMAADNKLTAVEKSAASQQWAIIAGEKTTIDAQATAYSITTEKTNYDNAYTALNTYLNDVSTGLLHDLTTTSTIDGPTYRTNFQTYYSTKAILEKAISDAAKTAAANAATAAANAQSTADGATTAASNAQTTANSAISAINDMAADNKLTAVEKSATSQQWVIISGEKSTIDAQATAYNITAEKTSYDNAYNTLNTYLNDVSTGLLKDLTTTSDINGTTYRTNFQNYYSTKAALQKAISDAAKALADAAQSTANSAQSAISDMAADNKLTAVEKSATSQQWAIISGEKATIDAQATAYGITTEKTNYDNAYTALSTYLNDASTGVLKDMASTVTIDGAAYRTNFQSYYSTKALLEKAISDAAKTAATNAQSTADSALTTAGNAMAAVNDMASDSKLTPLEKSATSQQWAIIAGERAAVDAQATAYGITTEKTNYDNAYAALNSYLNDGTSGLLKDITTTSTIDGPTYRTNFQTYYNSKAQLETAVSNAAKALADAAQATASNVQASISDMSSDDKITPVEKLQIKQQWDTITSEKPTLDTQAESFSAGNYSRIEDMTYDQFKNYMYVDIDGVIYNAASAKANYDAAYDTLNTYLNGASGPLANLTTTTDLGTGGGQTMRSYFSDYYAKKALLMQAMVDASKALAGDSEAKADITHTVASSALQAIQDMSADDKLTPVEKLQAKNQWITIAAEKSTTDTQADAFSLTTEKATYDAAYASLDSYLNGTGGVLTDLATTSNIAGDTFRGAFGSYYSARAALQKAISDAAKAIADAAQSTANSAQSAANTAQGAADNAQQSADSANSQLTLWAYPTTTLIDGGKIYTGSVTANAIAAGSITAAHIQGQTLNLDDDNLKIQSSNQGMVLDSNGITITAATGAHTIFNQEGLTWYNAGGAAQGAIRRIVYGTVPTGKYVRLNWDTEPYLIVAPKRFATYNPAYSQGLETNCVAYDVSEAGFRVRIDLKVSGRTSYSYGDDTSDTIVQVCGWGDYAGGSLDAELEHQSSSSANSITVQTTFCLGGTGSMQYQMYYRDVTNAGSWILFGGHTFVVTTDNFKNSYETFTDSVFDLTPSVYAIRYAILSYSGHGGYMDRIVTTFYYGQTISTDGEVSFLAMEAPGSNMYIIED